MNLILTNTDYLATGIFGTLEDEYESFLLQTIQHSYEVEPGVYAPKLPVGGYTCKRGMHILEKMHEPFETFEICGVPGHTNILFHVGNTNKDSSGCVLLGLFRSGDDSIMQSRAAFSLFMQKQTGVDEFYLAVN